MKVVHKIDDIILALINSDYCQWGDTSKTYFHGDAIIKFNMGKIYPAGLSLVAQLEQPLPIPYIKNVTTEKCTTTATIPDSVETKVLSGAEKSDISAGCSRSCRSPDSQCNSDLLSSAILRWHYTDVGMYFDEKHILITEYQFTYQAICKNTILLLKELYKYYLTVNQKSEEYRKQLVLRGKFISDPRNQPKRNKLQH